MSGEMERLDTLLPRVLPLVLPCPRGMALDALQAVAVDFCKETGVWRGNYFAELQPGERVICPELPGNAVMDRVYATRLNGEKHADYENTGREIILKECNATVCLCEIEASLRPLRTSETLPRMIIEEYGDLISYGALAKIKAMSGQKVEWTDNTGAQTAWGLYQEGVTRAKAKMFRKRAAHGVLYVNLEEA